MNQSNLTHAYDLYLLIVFIHYFLSKDMSLIIFRNLNLPNVIRAATMTSFYAKVVHLLMMVPISPSLKLQMLTVLVLVAGFSIYKTTALRDYALIMMNSFAFMNILAQFVIVLLLGRTSDLIDQRIANLLEIQVIKSTLMLMMKLMIIMLKLVLKVSLILNYSHRIITQFTAL